MAAVCSGEQSSVRGEDGRQKSCKRHKLGAPGCQVTQPFWNWSRSRAGAGRAAPAPTRVPLAEEEGGGGSENNGRAGSQTELQYCSDKATGRRGRGLWGAAREPDTPAAGATAATGTRSRRERDVSPGLPSGEQRAPQDSERNGGESQEPVTTRS